MQNTSVKAALRFLCQRMPSDLDLHHSDYVQMLMELQEKGEEYIEGLAGFYLYAIRNMGERQSKAILSTFSHDLGGRKDKWCEPRSASYAEIWREEYAKCNPLKP
ncbi:MAG TPA: hypothetical protein VGK47_06785 [Nitrososphaeraceae archaeon]